MVTVLTRGKDLYGKLKREIAESVLSQSMMLLSHTSEENRRRILMAAFNRISKTDHQKTIANWINNWLSDGHPGGTFLTRVLKEVHPNVRKNYISNMVVG